MDKQINIEKTCWIIENLRLLYNVTWSTIEPVCLQFSFLNLFCSISQYQIIFIIDPVNTTSLVFIGVMHFSEWASEWVSEWVSELVSEWVSQSVSHSVNQSVSQSIGQPVSQITTKTAKHILKNYKEKTEIF